MIKYLVWVSGLRGPEAQLWDEVNKMRDGKPIATLKPPVQLGPLEASQSLELLMVSYPYDNK